MSDAGGLRGRLAGVRADPTRRRGALVVAAVVGVALVQVHWAGLLVGGVLVGLVSRDLPRALAAGLALGVVVLVVFAVLTLGGDVASFLAMTPISYVAVGSALGLPVVGSLIRGVV